MYVDLVAGEIALRERNGQAAVDAFALAMKKHDSARAQWGLARGYQMLGDREQAAAAARATQKLSENHAGARVAVAGLLLGDGEVDQAYELLQAPAGLAPVEGETLQVAVGDKSAALTLVGRNRGTPWTAGRGARNVRKGNRAGHQQRRCRARSGAARSARTCLSGRVRPLSDSARNPRFHPVPRWT